MAMRVRPDTGVVGLQQWYRVASWSECDRRSWRPPRPLGCGKLGLYSKRANQTCLTIETLFKLPDHTYMSRRAGELSARIPRQRPTHVVVESTGLKMFGEGEWKVRQHGVGKRRTWRNILLAVDETTRDIIGIEVTTTAWGDREILPGLLDQVEGGITQVSADGAYDSHGCHAAIADRNLRGHPRPTRRSGHIGRRPLPSRDAIIRGIEVKGLGGWRTESGYHRRSIAENMMYRFKQLGDTQFSRSFERQVNEVHARAAIIETFTSLGMVESVRAGKAGLRHSDSI